MQTFTRGETFLLAVRNLDSVAYTSAAAKLKKTLDGVPVGESLFSFAVTYTAALPDSMGPGWLLRATPEQTVGLEIATYAVDLRVILPNDDVEITEIELIKVQPGVTETA